MSIQQSSVAMVEPELKFWLLTWMPDVQPLHEGLVLSRDIVTPPPLNATAACVTICVPSACVGQLAVFLPLHGWSAILYVSLTAAWELSCCLDSS